MCCRLSSTAVFLPRYLSVYDNGNFLVAFSVSVDVLGLKTVGPNLSATTSCNVAMYQRGKYWLDVALSPLDMIVVGDGVIIEALILFIARFYIKKLSVSILIFFQFPPHLVIQL